MIKLINKILIYNKIVFLLIAFTITLYILFLRMDYLDLGIGSLLPLFIPLLLVLIGYVFSYFLNKANDNIFYNISCVLVLLAIIVIDYRTVFDHNIISIYNINIGYFNIHTLKIEVMLYLTFIGNLMLFYKEKKQSIKIHS